MKRKISLILVLSLVFTTLFSGFAFADTENNLNSIIEEIAKQQAQIMINNYGVTSLQYAVMDKGEIIAEGNAGVFSKTENRALESTTMYGIGSVSKMFGTVIAMKLSELGKLDIDKPIINYLPEFEMADARYKEITARMLLNHSSGLNGSTFTNAFLYNDNDTYAHDNLLQELKTQSLKANPGEFSVYCNDGFTLLELLLEKISGISFTELVDKYITTPLKMENTKTPLDDFDKDNLARAYNAGSSNAIPNETLNVIATGGIYSTAVDMCKFSTIFTQETKILKEESVKMMQESEAKKGMWVDSDDSFFEYGLGWDSVNLFPFDDYGIKAVVKGGDSIYYHSTILVLPEHDLSVVINSSGGAAVYNQLMATNILLEALKQKNVISEINPPKAFVVPSAGVVPEELKSYAGIYADAASYFALSITQDNKLLIKNALIPDYPELYLVYGEDGAFYSEEGSIRIKLLKEDNNKIYAYIDQYGILPGLGQSAASMYYLQKLEENKLSKEVSAAWKARNYSQYFLVNEKYTSIAYSSLPIAGIAVFDFMPGYLLGAKIIDENTALNQIQMPVLAGRDTIDYVFSTKDDVEYLTAAGRLYVSSKILEPIYKEGGTCTIQDTGYTRWYYIDETSANKSISVEDVKNGGFVIYDATGVCIFNSVTDKNIEDIRLPLNGFMAFISDPMTQFTITIK